MGDVEPVGVKTHRYVEFKTCGYGGAHGRSGGDETGCGIYGPARGLCVPADSLSDGVQTYLVNDARSGDKLASFTILAGDTLSDDIRAEIDLLRAELDMLKKSFRHHCNETG